MFSELKANMEKDDDNPTGPKWISIACRSLGTAAGLLQFIFGISTCITIVAKCIFAGVMMILFGLIIFLVEAPCCLGFISALDRVAQLVAKMPIWSRGVIYLIMGILPICFCPEYPSSIIINVLVIFAALLYVYKWWLVFRSGSSQGAPQQLGQESPINPGAGGMGGGGVGGGAMGAAMGGAAGAAGGYYDSQAATAAAGYAADKAFSAY